MKRKLDNLNLMDDFLFGSMLTYPGIGESFARILLRIILNREFGNLKVIPQKVYYGSGTEYHGARLDVFAEGQELLERKTGIFDMESENDSRKESVEALPRRVRFYHAVIDSHSLESGKNYHELRDVVIILITPFDPFGKGRMVYTIRNHCVEDAEIPYDDGAETLFLYTKGTEGKPPEPLKELLRYMEDTVPANAVNKDLQEIQRMVDTVKEDKEVGLRYMKIFEREEMIREIAREEGMAEERINTERERKRADYEAMRACRAEEQLRKLMEELKRTP